MKKTKLPHDPNQRAKSIVDMATSESPDAPEPSPETISEVMRAMGRRGGQKGGKVRAERLSPAKRKQIAKKAARARWGSPKK